MTSIKEKINAFITTTFITSLSFLTIGCGQDENENSDEEQSNVEPTDDFELKSTIFKPEYKNVSTGLSEGSVMGTWRRKQYGYEEVYQFNSDGTMVEDSVYVDPLADDGSTWTGFWAIDGNLLSMETFLDEEYEEYGEVVKSLETVRVVTNTAIVDNALYFDVLVRTSGDTSGLDGTWASYLRVSEDYELNGKYIYSESYDDYASLVFEISGDKAKIVYESHFEDEYSDNGDYRDVKVEGSASLRVEGDEIYLTIDELSEGHLDLDDLDDGGLCNVYWDDDLDEGDEDGEYLLGYLASDNVIVPSGWDTYSITDLAFTKDDE